MTLLLSGLMLGVLLSEAVVRVIGYDGAHGRRHPLFGSRYGIVPPDNWIFRLAIDPAAQTHAEIRGQKVALAKPADTTRMLFVGDSGTAGLFVELEQSFPLQFRALLDRRDPDHRVEVINAGAVAMTTVGELYLLRDVLAPLSPDVVVLGLFMANDINFNLGHQERRDAWGNGWMDRLTRHSALAHFLRLRALEAEPRNRLWSATPDVALTLVDSHGLHMLSDPAGEIATYKREPSELIERAYVVLGNTLREFRELGRERGFSFVVLLIPTRSAVRGGLDLPHHPRMLEDLTAHGIHVREEDLDFGLPTRRVRAICAELGVPCIDPTARMQRVGMEVFLTEDEHTTVLGHRVLAQELMEHLEVLLPRD